MCGIAGFISSEKVEQSSLRTALSCLSHRGPDADGLYFNERVNVGLGHRRLSILDLSEAANQPMTSASGRWVIIFNGEVYNFKEIARELKVPLRTTSDTEVILEAYAAWGPAFVNRLNGMFSMAIYDKKEETLFLCRDRMGIKPIYYYQDDSLFAFASELKALDTMPELKDRISLNYGAVLSFLHLGYVPAPDSIYKEIKKFPQGCTTLLRAGEKIAFYQYWDPKEKIATETFADEQQAVNLLHEKLKESVSKRLISDVPYGTFLSGGIDSSLVTAIASKLAPERLNTFSIGFEESAFNESKYANAVAKYLGTNHHEFILSEKDAVALVCEILPTYDEPFADSSAIPTMLVSKMASQQVKMILTGDGGDELFMGYGMYAWAERLQKPWIKASGPLLNAVLRHSPVNRHKRAAALFQLPFGGAIEDHIFSQEQYLFSNRELQQDLLKPTVANYFSYKGMTAPARTLSPAEQQAFFDLTYYLPDDLLVKVDRASMKWGLECRVPLLDYEVVEFALNIAPHLKMHPEGAKHLLKQVLYQYIPRAYFDRPKWGFSIPLAKWLRNDLKSLLLEILSPDNLARHGIVKPAYVTALISRYFKGEDYLYNRLWALLQLHLWLDKHKK
ncbi:MAG: asparagine synthase (glutamine-hydrolyzing) [Bacteroidetes bacterium]|nr:asparagine synthase (glutamine-hydrolyzing) [Bacteroidota bacterium]